MVDEFAGHKTSSHREANRSRAMINGVTGLRAYLKELLPGHREGDNHFLLYLKGVRGRFNR